MLRKTGFASLVLITLLVATGNLCAQGPDSLWHRAFGDTLNDWGFSVIETHDGYFVTAGQIQVYNPDSGTVFLDVYVLKLNSDGDTLWARTYGGDRIDGSRSVIEASDGNYVVTGYTDSWSPGDNDIYVIKIDPDGNLVWEHTIGSSRGDEESFCVRESPDSSYRIVGTTDRFGSDDVLLAGIASDGSWIWEYPYNIPGHQSAHELAFTPEGYLIIVGTYFGPTVDVYLMKTETDGDTLWTQTYDFGPLDYGMSVKSVSYHSYIVTGYSQALIAPFYNAFLLHLQIDGDVNWSRFYGGSGHDNSYSVQVMPEGGFVFTGQTESYGAGGGDVWLVRTDTSGDTLWTMTYGGTNNDIGQEVQATSDGGFMIGGSTSSFGNGFNDLYLVKTEGDPAGVFRSEREGVGLSVSTLPNPTGTSTTLTYELRGPHRADLAVYDLAGRRVKTLRAEGRSAGAHSVTWDGFNDRGERVSPGVYFIHLRAGYGSATQKITMLR